jgi:hypothetical protein
MIEQRAEPRQKSFLRGCIYFNNRRSSVDCLIRDISEGGARLIFPNAVAIPDTVDIYVPQKDQMLHARVQWRLADEIGVAFIPDPHAAEGGGPNGDHGERIHKLETEIAALRRTVKKLQAALTAAGLDAA